MTSLLELLVRDGRHAGRIYGVVTAVVTDNKDIDKLGRVRIRFPWLSDSEQSWWARVATPMAGEERGVFFLPEVEDEVLVAFEHGDAGRPFVIGALWNDDAKPPVTNENGRNDIRMIKSRSGHVIRFDDREGEGKIEIVDKSQKNSIVIDVAANTITISADADITIKSARGKLRLEGAGVEIESCGKLRLEGAGVEIESSGDLDLTASGETTVKGDVVNIN